MKRALSSLALLATLLLCSVAAAAPREGADGDVLGRPLGLVVALAMVSLLPFAFMSVTAFVKVSTVLQISKSALGAQSVPSNMVVMALAASLTVLAMMPTADKIIARAAPLVAKEKIETLALLQGGFEAVREPLREFLSKHASPQEKARFVSLVERQRGQATATDLSVLVPAFLVTELTEAFAIGFLIYLPFLVIEIVVTNVLLALGMQMLNPTQVSLPFKLLLFVAVDGWGLLAQALVDSYR